MAATFNDYVLVHKSQHAFEGMEAGECFMGENCDRL